MQQVTIISGGSLNERFTKAFDIAADRPTEVIPDYVSEIQVKEYLGVAEVLILSEVNLRNYKPITALINTNSCLARKPYLEGSIPVERPELVVLINDIRLFQDQAFGTAPWIKYLKY